MVKNISREELPQFNSHDEARAYFEQKYGDSNFQLIEEIVDQSEGTFYLYKLIVDPEANQAGLEEIKQKGYCSSEAFIQSTQRIKIMENGEVHI
ncbi:MAG: hypothetical protein APF84_02405 [Gracilibacter sp. BRH_c7a]|nr:MAG: hypothetical protein APF84_02405 [Gracilibacter sp. BRH_c7a]